MSGAVAEDAAALPPLLCTGLTTYNALRNTGVWAGDLRAVQGVGGLAARLKIDENEIQELGNAAHG